jgi:replicative DNA helicase
MKRDTVSPEFTVSDLEAFHALQFPNLREKEKDVFHAIFSQLQSLPVADGVSQVLLDSLAQRARAAQIAVQAFEFSEGRASWDDFQASLTAASESSSLPVEELQPVTNRLEELYQKSMAEIGLRWRLASLNLRLGSLRKGNFGFVFARPETGKTTFLASEVTYMAASAKAAGAGPVLWFNNEQQGEEVMLRCYEAHFGLPLDTILKERQKYAQMYLDEVGDGLIIIDQAQIHRTYVEKLCARLKPSLVVFDQIDKITGFEADRTDLQLGAIYIWAREIAKEHAPVIGICQADGTGEGIKWLTMGHVANAKTSKQAEADWILGIGRSNDPGFDYIRFMHLSKNKLRGDPDTNRQLRHDRWEVLLEPEKARYTDID